MSDDLRCSSVHYWSRMQCQHNAGHSEPHAADPREGPPWVIDGRRQVYLWVDGPSGLGCDQRPYEAVCRPSGEPPQ